jgi:hypothetical protein
LADISRVAENEFEVLEAFGKIKTDNFGSGEDEYSGEAGAAAACFWVATTHDLYGEFYKIGYKEVRTNIVDLYLRYGEIHEANPERQSDSVLHRHSLFEAHLVSTEEDTLVTKEQYRELGNEDIKIGSMASSAATDAVNRYFLWPRFIPMRRHSHLLNFAVRVKEGPNRVPKYHVEIMSPHINEMVMCEQLGTAQYYAIASTSNSHFINLRAHTTPNNWSDWERIQDQQLCEFIPYLDIKNQSQERRPNRRKSFHV